MNAHQLVERIRHPQLLTDDNSQQWAQLCAKYPYSCVLQWLNHSRGQERSSEKISPLFHSHPLLWNRWQHHRRANFKLKLSQNLTEMDPHFLVQVQSGNSFTDTQPAEPWSDSKNLVTQPESGNLNPPSTTEDDILGIIRELPDTPLIPKKPVVLINDNQNNTEITTTEIRNESQKSGTDTSLLLVMSFTDWLRHFKIKQQAEQEEIQSRKALRANWQKEKLAAAADEELDEIPEPLFHQAMESIREENTLISESLAGILAQQGKTDKAITMYKKLSLQNPEKKAYFADLIQKLTSQID